MSFDAKELTLSNGKIKSSGLQSHQTLSNPLIFNVYEETNTPHIVSNINGRISRKYENIAADAYFRILNCIPGNTSSHKI